MASTMDGALGGHESLLVQVAGHMLYDRYEPLPGNDPIHLIEKDHPASALALTLVFGVREAELIRI